MISRAGDSIWVMAAAPRRGTPGPGRGPNPVPSWTEEQARARRAWDLRRQNNELLDKQWSEPIPEPLDQVDIGQLLDQEYARHQRRNRSWSPPVFDPTPVDTSLPREEWDDRVRGFLRNPTRVPGSAIAKDPHALAGEDAVMGIRSSLVKTLGGDGITNKGVADKIKDHYGIGNANRGGIS